MTLRPTTIKKHAGRGRPSNDPQQSDFKKGALYSKFMEAFPQFCDWEGDHQVLNIAEFAAFIGKSRYAVYRWCGGKRMSATTASMLVEKSAGKITIEDLLTNLV